MNTHSHRKLNLKNAHYCGAENRKSVYDLQIPEAWNNKLVIFVHGYMGFKDWGCWPLVQSLFVESGYAFLKYNVSHNGGTVENPIDFHDLDAFSQNNYSKELHDLEAIIETSKTHFEKTPDIYLIGHSRGGGIVALQSGLPEVKKWCAWAPISSIAKRFPADVVETWEKEVVRFTTNSRTQQQMPHHISQYWDFEQNAERLNIEAHCKANEKPCLVIHGTEDVSVSISEGEEMAAWTGAKLVRITGAQHTFGASQPWPYEKIPSELDQVCQQTLLFFEHGNF